MDQTGLKALILGASGAVGRELVDELLNSQKWSEVHVIVRRSLPQWDQIKNKQKLRIQIVENLDSLENTQNWKFLNLNTSFCCLGSRTKEGEAQLTKVDLTYPQYGVRIALFNEIPHFSLVSSSTANVNSWFLFPRIKGLAEQVVTKAGFKMASIHHPGAILNRDNDFRFGESVLQYIPFLPKIESKDLAKALRIEAEIIANELPNQATTKTYTNQDLLNLLTTDN